MINGWLLLFIITHNSDIAADRTFFFCASLHEWTDARNISTHVSCASPFHVNIFLFLAFCRCSPQSDVHHFTLFLVFQYKRIYRTRLSIETLLSNINFLFIFTCNLNRTIFFYLSMSGYTQLCESFFSLFRFPVSFCTSGLWIEIRTAIHALKVVVESNFNSLFYLLDRWVFVLLKPLEVSVAMILVLCLCWIV